MTAGYYTSLSVPGAPSPRTAARDGGSNVDATTSILQRDDIALTNGSCGSFTGSWSTVTLSGGNDTSVTNGNCYRYRELLSDNVGNQGASAASNTVKVDTSAPSAPSLAFSGLSANAYYNGSGTLYIRPSAGGTFTVTGSSTDAQSGIGSYTFGTLNSNGGSNFGGSQTGDHYDYTFGASTTAPSTARTVSATNGAGTGSSDTTYSIAADTTAPSMTAPSVTAGYYTSLSVPVTKNGGTDGGSDIDNTTSILQRDDITLTNGNCGSFAGSWSAVTLVGGNDTTVLSGHCYRYRELLSDHVGNQGTSGASSVAKVDTQGPANSLSTSSVSPAGSVYKSGATIFYRGSAAGSFKLTNAVTDGESGPASSATGALGGTSTGWSHSASTVSSPAGGPYESNAFSWNSGTTSSPTEVVTGADSAGNTTASSTLTLTNDSSAPTGGALTVNNVAATPIGPVSYDTDGSFPIDVRTDYTEPGGESGLAASTLVRTSASFSSADTCGSFGSPVTVVGSPSQSGLTTGCYMYTLTGTDNVGNTVSISTVVKVDTNNPSVSLTDPGTPLAGTVSLDASASDASTNVQQVVFERAPAGGSTWTTIGSDSSSPYSTSWSTGGVTDGLYDVRAVATDTAGNTNTSLVASRRVDNTAPNTTIDSGPADPSNDTTPDFSFSSSETGSTFQCRVDGGSWSSCTSPETISPALGEGSHTFDVRATDAAGNTDASPATSTWTVDTTAPNTTIDSSPASPSGNTTPTFTFSSSETGSTFECRLDGGTWDPCTSPDTLSPALAEGSHTFDVRATDPAGNTDAKPGKPYLDHRRRPTEHHDRHEPRQPVQRHHPDVHLQLERTGLDLRVPTRRWRVDRMHVAAHRCPGAGRRDPHVRRPRDGCRRQHGCIAGELHLDGRPDRAEHHDRLRARESVERRDALVRLQRDGARLDLRVPRRRRQLDRLHEPGHTRSARRRQPHLRRARDRPGRQHRRHARELHVDRRPDRARTRRSTPTPRIRRTTQRPTSPSAPPRPARPSSAASTAAAGRPARAPKRSRRHSARAATPSTCAQPTRPATPTARPPATPGPST